MTVSKELWKYKLDFMEGQGVRWEGGSSKPAGEYMFLLKVE
jgi:hypothetical protein